MTIQYFFLHFTHKPYSRNNSDIKLQHNTPAIFYSNVTNLQFNIYR
jgi:hypothetical protein